MIDVCCWCYRYLNLSHKTRDLVPVLFVFKRTQTNIQIISKRFEIKSLLYKRIHFEHLFLLRLQMIFDNDDFFFRKL